MGHVEDTAKAEGVSVGTEGALHWHGSQHWEGDETSHHVLNGARVPGGSASQNQLGTGAARPSSTALPGVSRGNGFCA